LIYVTYLYLLRVPLIVAALLAGFPLFAQFTGSGSALFGNLFDLTFSGTFWLTFAASILAWSILLTSNVIMFNSRERFGIRPFRTIGDLSWRWIVGVHALVIPVLIPQVVSWSEFREGGPGLRFAAGALVGYVTAYAVAAFSLYAAILIAPPGQKPEQFPVPSGFRNWLKKADAISLLPAGWITRLKNLGTKLPRDLRQGFLASDGLPWSGHWLLLTFSIATFLIYKLIDWFQISHLGSEVGFPAILFVFWLFLNINWMFSFLSFLLDRFRLPLIVPFALACIIASQFASSDHYFDIREGITTQRIPPAAVLNGRITSPRRPPIVLVATAGGGIQAAAWTAQVLTGLQEKSLGWNSTRDFSRDIALISSVSGGATGAMYYLNQYRSSEQKFTLAKERLHDVVTMAEGSSLNDVAWALVYHDIPRLYFPYTLNQRENLIDRGLMLEESWKNRDRISSYLSNWREGVREGWRPATIFNSTVAETGEPFLFATTDLAATGPGVHGCYPGATPERRSFTDCYPDSDLPVVTAVRLAATFPFVSPGARANTSQPEVHLVDGGYYDNFGVASLVQWLTEAAKGVAGDASPPPMLVIQIRSFPDDQLDVPTRKSALFQLYAPVDAMMNSRTTAQLVRDRDDLARLQDRWKNNDGTPLIQTATFQFHGRNAPLSWAMNESQKAAIKDQWNHFDEKQCGPDSGNDGCETQVVRCFIDPPNPKSAEGALCDKLRCRKRVW